VWKRRKGDLLHPERVPIEFLEQRRLELGNRFFGAQYQQNPIIADGSQIRLSWFGQYDDRPSATPSTASSRAGTPRPPIARHRTSRLA